MTSEDFRISCLLVVIAAMCGCAAGSDVATSPDPSKGVARKMTVTSPSFQEGQPIPQENSAYGANKSPKLHWAEAPPDTKAFAIVLEDPDSHNPKPFIHWLVYNIPPTVGEIEAGLPASERLNQPTAAMQGKNSNGEVGYFGPRPPKGDPPHHYHFKVYALDTLLQLQPGADQPALLNAMQGHVVSSGELVGTYQAS